ncbi:MAG: SDR family oxidoreductase [Gammaproteobacteria bacterium]
MGRLDGKVVIITGALGGIGRADAALFAREGARLVLTDLSERGAEEFLATLGTEALFIRHDVASEEQWVEVVASAERRFGKLDVLVNNAGLMRIGTVDQTSLEDWRRVMAVNLDGVFLGCKHALPAIERAGGGSIVNIASIASKLGVSFTAAYCASKGGVASLTRAIAVQCREKKNNVRCNSVHPDGVKTPMVVKVATGREEASRAEIEALASGSTRFCEPEDVAAVVCFLASDEARYMNGAEILVDNAAFVTGPS